MENLQKIITNLQYALETLNKLEHLNIDAVDNGINSVEDALSASYDLREQFIIMRNCLGVK